MKTHFFKWESPCHLDSGAVQSVVSEPLVLGRFTFVASACRRIANGFYRPEIKVTIENVSTWLTGFAYDSFTVEDAQKACDDQIVQLITPLAEALQ